MIRTLAFQGSATSPRHRVAHRGVAIIAAPLLGTEPAAGLTTRQRRLAEALDAERARDHARTATILSGATSPRHRVAHRGLAIITPRCSGPSGLTTRQRKLAEALDAERARDHARTATILGELVDDPDEHWDYPERLALIRNLRAAGDRARLAARCGELERPPVFRYELLIARRACREALS